MTLKGTITALITPFDQVQQVNYPGLAENIRFQLSSNVDGILVLGTTGEASTLQAEEQTKIISLAVHEAKEKAPIWVGTGSYCTKQTIEKTKRAYDLGADIALIVTPYYNKPTQEGIFRHFEAIATQVKIPIVIYNIPGRCSANIETSTLKRLVELPNIIGIKEASGNLNQIDDILSDIAVQHPQFALFSGDDALTLPMMALGAVGVVSVVSNLVPQKIVSLVRAASEGYFDKARQLHQQLRPLFKAAFVETNPIPIKAAMNLCGMAAGTCRLPLYEMNPSNLDYLERLLSHLNLVNLIPLEINK